MTKEGSGSVSFNENVMEHLFIEKMSKMDCTTLTKPGNSTVNISKVIGFTVYDRYFITVNEKNNKVKKVEKRDPPDYFALVV